MKKKLAILAVASLCLSGAAQAADTPETVNDLDPIVVTATRTVRNAMDTNANVEVLSGRTIETHHYSDLTEALRDVPGVSITRHGSGVGFDQTDSLLLNGSNKVVVLIDGMRANLNGSTFTGFNYGALKDMSNIERIEVLKGSASTLYGSDAKGGVINIITKKGSMTPKTTIGFETGSFGKEQYRLQTTGKSGKVFYTLGYMKDITGDYKDGHGVKVPSHSNTTSWNAKFVAEMNEKSKVSLAVERYTGNYSYQNYAYNYQTSANDKVVQKGSMRDVNLRLAWDYRINDHMKNQFGIYDHQVYSDYNNWIMDVETLGVSDQFTAKLGKSNELVAGFDIFQEKLKDYDYLDGIYREQFSDKSVTTKAIYIQDRWDVTNRFNLTGGLRYTHHSKSGGNTSLAVTAGYDVNKKTNVYASYKQYFIAPKLYQFYSPYGSEDLKAERGYTYEFGISHKFTDSFGAKFHIFHRKASNAIGYNLATSKYDNVDEESTNGWDISLNKAFNPRLSMDVGYTHLRVKEYTESYGNYVDRLIPNGEWHIGLNYDDHKAWAASITGRGIIGRTGKVDNAFPKNTYWVWDAAVNYTFKPGIRLYVKANNIFNQYYAEVTDVTSVYSTPGQWYSAPGRNFVVGLDFTF